MMVVVSTWVSRVCILLILNAIRVRGALDLFTESDALDYIE